MSHNPYYAPTAYDSSKPRELPPRKPSAMLTPTARALRGKDRTLAWGLYFRDFRNTNARRDVVELKQGRKALTMYISPEQMKLTTLNNPKAAWAMVRGVAGLVCIVVGAMEAVRISSRGLSHVIERSLGDPVSLMIPGVPLVVFLLAAIVVPFAKDKNNILFNRRTGMISLPRQRISLTAYPEQELHFDEFDAYLNLGFDGKSGATYWRLHLGHRATSRGFDIFDRFYKPAYAFQAWELVQQFMDISKPLPDVAVYEAVRHLDPVTAEYDRRTGRPPNYWRDRNPDEVAHEADEVDAVVREFFWESLPRGNDPYEQDAWIDAWRSHYTDQAAMVDGLKRKGWWPGKEREAQVASFPEV